MKKGILIIDFQKECYFSDEAIQGITDFLNKYKGSVDIISVRFNNIRGSRSALLLEEATNFKTDFDTTAESNYFKGYDKEIVKNTYGIGTSEIECLASTYDTLVVTGGYTESCALVCMMQLFSAGIKIITNKDLLSTNNTEVGKAAEKVLWWNLDPFRSMDDIASLLLSDK